MIKFVMIEELRVIVQLRNGEQFVETFSCLETRDSFLSALADLN